MFYKIFKKKFIKLNFDIFILLLFYIVIKNNLIKYNNIIYLINY